MSTFVLVHGAWHGSWCWKRVRKILQAQGHDVFTPTLTGVADRSHLNAPSVNLDTHIEDVVNLIRWEELTDVVLCGHSYGGMVVTGIADRVPHRIRALVYLDAFVPEDGENLIQHIPSEQAAGLMEGMKAVGDGWKMPPIPAEVFNLNEADRDWVNSQCTMQSVETFQQPIRLTGGVEKISNVTYIRASGFEEGSPFPPFLEKARSKGWVTHEIDCGHDVMVDKPEQLSQLLLEAAA
jgi:pimeloyl-ACP methyl ester carboxylesterase